MVQERFVIGRHTVTLEDDDTIVVRIHGDVDVATAREFLARVDEVNARIGRAFLIIDQTRPGTIRPEAQRLSIDWATRQQVSGAVLFGASLLQHTVYSLMLSTARLLRPDLFPVRFAKDELEARAWVAAQRVRILTLIAPSPSAKSSSRG